MNVLLLAGPGRDSLLGIFSRNRVVFFCTLHNVAGSSFLFFVGNNRRNGYKPSEVISTLLGIQCDC